MDRNQSITLSVLDRLLDDTPEHVAPRPHTVADLRAAIRRDLENLLNTRRRVLGWPDDLTELADSILGYGCHDLLVENVATESRRREVVAQIEAAIRPDSIFASNTSTLPISGLAKSSSRPG